MIEKNTVLILGAGASNDYGYPLGSGLRDSILNLVKIPNEVLTEVQRKSDNELILKDNIEMSLGRHLELAEYIVKRRGVTLADIATFSSHFSRASKPSIDTFLENRSEFLELGKILIAISILKCENETVLYRNNLNSWYHYLMRNINHSWDDFSQNKLSIITYNYDRSLEYFMVNDLMNCYNKSFEECLNKVQSAIPFYHVHGKICNFEVNNSKPYVGRFTPSDLDNAANKLHIITEESEIINSYSEIHQLLGNAENVFILGFGFDSRNLKRLELLRYAGKANVFSTRTGLTNLEVKTINNTVGNLIHFSNDSNRNIVDFFRHDVSLMGAASRMIKSFKEQLGGGGI